MPSDPQDPAVVVTEADRELFLALQLYSASSAVDVARGMADRSRNMQKIAAFRLSTQSAMQARIEKLEAALRFIEQHPWGDHDCAQVLHDVQNYARAALSSAIGQPGATSFRPDRQDQSVCAAAPHSSTRRGWFDQRIIANKR